MEHDNTDKLPQQTSPVEQPEGESSRAEVDKAGDTTTRELGEKGTQAALLTDEEGTQAAPLTDEEGTQIEDRIKEFYKHKALMEEPPKGVDPNTVKKMQNSMALQRDLANGVKPPLEVGDK